MESYSQNNEQEIILNYFRDFKGVFIDIGCNDGVTLSNTLALKSLGWTGVYVDASPTAYEKLKENLFMGKMGKDKKDWMVNIAFADHDGKIILNDSGSLITLSDRALVSTVHSQQKMRYEKFVAYNEVEVDCCTWKTFISLCPYKHFDFISLDIEGSEMSVLPYMDLSQTKMICIEFNGYQELKEQYEQYLEGFKLIYTSAENLIYITTL